MKLIKCRITFFIHSQLVMMKVGGALIYLQGKDGFGIYYNSFGNLDMEDAVKIAPSLTELLVNNVGVNILLDIWEHVENLVL